MADRMEFREKLGGILKMANELGRRITMEEVEKYFEEDNLSEEQIGLVCDYLLSEKVVVSGYEKKGGSVIPAGEELQFTEEEQEYLKEYEHDLRALRGAKEDELAGLFARAVRPDAEAKQRLTEAYLPIVAEIAKTQYNPEIFLGDLIQEGNVSLIMALEMLETAEDADAFLRKEILQGIQAMQEVYKEEKSRDSQMVEKVNELDASITKLTEEMGRKITIEELSMFMDIPVEEIVSVMRLAGEDIEVGEVNPNDIFQISDEASENAPSEGDVTMEDYAAKLTEGFDDMEYKPGE